MKNLVSFFSFLVSLVYGQLVLADTATELENLFEQNVAFTQAEDIDGVMSTLHTQSPIYAMQSNSLKQINAAYNLKYQVLDFYYVGQDELYAYARFTLKTTKLSGPDFRDSQLNALIAFKKEESVWKVWNQVNLEITFD